MTDKNLIWTLILLLLLACLILSAGCTLILLQVGTPMPVVWAVGVVIGLGIGWRIGKLLAAALELEG